MRMVARFAAGLFSCLPLCSMAQTHGQPTVNVDIDIHFPAANIVVPQQCSFVVRPGVDRVSIQGVDATVDIVEQVATTTLKITLANPGQRQLEAELLVPVPAQATVRSFHFDGAGDWGGGPEPSVRLLPRDEARRLYESIVRRAQDPALLEFANYNLVRSSVFPVGPGATQVVTLTYENILDADGSRVDYILPRTESLELSTVRWTIAAHVRTRRPISTIYSPSHELATRTRADHEASVEVTAQSATQPGSFRLSYLLEDRGVTATLMAYPDAEVGGGYFLLLAGIPQKNDNDGPKQQREVMVVIDRSGSMKGEKIEQARSAAIAIVDGLELGEAFNIIDYSDSVAMFADKPLVKDARISADARAYLRALKADGGTNIHEALGMAVRMKPSEGMLPLVLFLTDGLPTVGNTSEVAIREDTSRANAFKRRIFTFGVGYDVNAPLLDRLAESARGTSINVLPNDNVETAVSQTFRRLRGPVLSEPNLTMLDAGGSPTTRAVREMIPPALPDLFEGDQLVILGQYKDADELRFRLDGGVHGDRTSGACEFRFKLDSATTRNAFVPRLWASRRIAMLVDEIRQRGAEAPSSDPHANPQTDPRTRELVEEIVRLSTRFGILTEYTAFLATEPGVKPDERHLSLRAAADEACKNLQERAVGVRSGAAGVNQSLNVKAQAAQACTNGKNEYWNAEMKRVSISTVQQIADQTLFLRDNRWVDCRISEKDPAAAPDRVVEFGSPEYFALAKTLADQGRPGIIAVRGEVYVLVDGKRVLIKGSGAAPRTDGQ